MCVKINIYAVRYILYMRVAQYAFLFTLAGPTHFARISKITTRQIRNVNVYKCC